jgi:hypothetical protein
VIAADAVYRIATLVAATPRRDGVAGILRLIWQTPDGETITDDLIVDAYAANWLVDQHARRIGELIIAARLTTPARNLQTFCEAAVGTRALLELQPAQRTGRLFVAHIAPANTTQEAIAA